MEKLRQGTVLHLGVKGLDDDEIHANIVVELFGSYETVKYKMFLFC